MELILFFFILNNSIPKLTQFKPVIYSTISKDRNNVRYMFNYKMHVTKFEFKTNSLNSEKPRIACLFTAALIGV